MKTLQVAVIGAGHLGKIHTRILKSLPQYQVVGVVDPAESNRQQVASEFGVPAFADCSQIPGRLDAAIVATPTMFHHQVGCELLARGVHLLIEKPLATTLEESESLVAAARRAGVTLQVGHVERFNPALTAALPHLREPKYIEATRASGYTFRSTDIGVVMDLMIHDIDVVLSLVRAPLAHVEALGVSVFGQHEDVANARLTFANGCVATLSASRANHGQARRMQVWGQGGFAQLDFMAGSASIVRPSEALMQRELHLESLSVDEKAALKDRLFAEHLPMETLVGQPINAIMAELNDFSDSVLNGRSPRVSGEQGRDAIAVATAVLAKIQNHAWDGTIDGPRGPLASPAARILRSPHWNAQTPTEHREAG